MGELQVGWVGESVEPARRGRWSGEGGVEQFVDGDGAAIEAGGTMGKAALASAGGDYGAGGGDFAAEVGGIDFLAEDGLVDGAKLGHGELGLQEAEGEVGVIDFIAKAAEAVGDDFFVVEGERDGDVVDLEPVDAAGAGAGAELMLSPAYESEVGDGDAVFAGIAIGAAEGVELL